MSSKPKEIFLPACLSIKLANSPNEIKEILDQLYQLHATNPETIPILAKILANTDFTNPAENSLVTKEQLNKIIAACKTEKAPCTYKSIRTIVDREALEVKFIPSLEYAKELANESPQDLTAIIKLFDPIFVEAVGISTSSNSLSEIAGVFIEKSTAPMIGGLITGQLKNLKSNDDGEIITGLLNIVAAARDLFIVGNKVKEKLGSIQANQKNNVSELLKQLNFNPESIAILTQPIEAIDLAQGDLTKSLNSLVTVTSWIKEFALRYTQLLELNKWNDSSENFLKLINQDLSKVKDHINSLLNLYISHPTLTKSNFCSPTQLLHKIGSQKLSPIHLEILQKIASKQASNTRIPLERLNLLLDITLKFPNPELAASLTDLGFNQEKHAGFPVDAFLGLLKNLKEEQEIVEITKDLQALFKEAKTPADQSALNSFLGVLLKNGTTTDDSIMRYYYLKKIHQDLDVTKQKQVFKIVEQILSQEHISGPQRPNSVHANIFQLLAYLKHLALQDSSTQELFAKISALYEQKPCPSSEQLLGMILDDENISEFVAKFAIDPYGKRLDKNGEPNQEFFAEQFSTDKLNQVIFGLSKNNPKLDGEFLQELKSDFNYINSIGSTYSFPGITPEKPGWRMTRDEIRAQLKKCQDTLKNNQATNSEKYLAKLHAIALLRETMYRATGKMPNST